MSQRHQQGWGSESSTESLNHFGNTCFNLTVSAYCVTVPYDIWVDHIFQQIQYPVFSQLTPSSPRLVFHPIDLSVDPLWVSEISSTSKRTRAIALPPRNRYRWNSHEEPVSIGSLKFEVQWFTGKKHGCSKHPPFSMILSDGQVALPGKNLYTHGYWIFSQHVPKLWFETGTPNLEENLFQTFLCHYPQPHWACHWSNLHDLEVWPHRLIREQVDQMAPFMKTGKLTGFRWRFSLYTNGTSKSGSLHISQRTRCSIRKREKRCHLF